MAEKKVKQTKPKKKTTRKKTAAKKTRPKQESVLKDAPEEHYFMLINGQPIKNLLELADTLEEIREEVFRHHVNPEKNDFSNWIQDIFEEKDLADELRQILDKNHARIRIYRHIIKRLQE